MRDEERPGRLSSLIPHPSSLETPHPSSLAYRLFLIDFDLHCEGDPGLDIGNFLGHITEQSLRALGDPQALADREQALEERFVALSGEATRAAVQAYATLTLVRHIHLSTLFPERRPFTSRLLELCEERLGHGHQP